MDSGSAVCKVSRKKNSKRKKASEITFKKYKYSYINQFNSCFMNMSVARKPFFRYICLLLEICLFVGDGFCSMGKWWTAQLFYF